MNWLLKPSIQAAQTNTHQSIPRADTLNSVHLVADLGFTDSCSWWGWQETPDGYRVVEFMEDDNQPIQHYIRLYLCYQHRRTIWTTGTTGTRRRSNWPTGPTRTSGSNRSYWYSRTHWTSRRTTRSNGSIRTIRTKWSNIHSDHMGSIIG